MDIGCRIKELRIKSGMSQEELGNKIGVKKAAINKYESGIVVNLKRSTILQLSEALNTTPAYLMGWEEKEEPANKGELKKEIEELFNGLSPEKQDQVLDFLRFLHGKS